MGGRRPERPKRLEEFLSWFKEFLSWFKAATFRVSAALFFLIPGVAAFLTGLLLPKDALALLASLLTLLPTVLSLTSSTLLKALEEDEKAIKRLAASASFIIVSFPGNWLAGMIFSSAFQGNGLWEWVLGSFFALFYGFFLIFPYFLSTSHLVGILFDVARKGGLLEENT
jgi:chromate transport protein ChrA